MKLIKPILRFLLGLIIRYLPEKDRRTFCLASLFYYLSDKEFYKGSGVNVDTLNVALNLSDDHALLELPKATSNLVWGETQVPEHLSNDLICSTGQCPSYEEAKRLAEQFVSASPRWLRYQHDAMIRDIVKQIYLAQPA
jgi:hypothetical protein